MNEYEKYLKLQRETTHGKHRRQWLDANSVAWIADVIRSKVRQPDRGICHGVRNGFEQLWFMERLPNCRVIGTDVAHWSDNTPYQIMWDMHDMRPDWSEAFDFVYTNSWDHAYDLNKALNSWVRSVAPGGMLVLTHSLDHTTPSPTDPTGLPLSRLIVAVENAIHRVCPNEEWETYIPDGAPDVHPPGYKASDPKPVDHAFFIRSHRPSEHPES